MPDTKPCRCPVRPYGPGLASGSSWEAARLFEWEAEHGHHDYAKARDMLAACLQSAESLVRRDEQGKAGEAVLDMVADMFGIARPSEPHPVSLEQYVAEAVKLEASDMGGGSERP